MDDLPDAGEHGRGSWTACRRPFEPELTPGAVGGAGWECRPDRGIVAFAIVCVVREIGIAPTVRHGTDLGYTPVVVADARGSVEEEARRRTLAGIDYTLMSVTTDTATFSPALRTASTS